MDFTILTLLAKTFMGKNNLTRTSKNRKASELGLRV